MHLSLKGNMITSLKPLAKQAGENDDPEAEEIVYWAKLTTLDVSINKIRQIGKINCPNLRKLDLSQNSIEKFTEEWIGLEKLEELDISSNFLSDMKLLTNMPALKVAYLGSNKFHKFGGLDGCPELRFIHIRGCKVNISY